ncbi:hypothetical protein M8C17_28985 [Micromonospora sp. RHAY321]|uniref:hypothetical protein n=1 Tax=Micromonospora sp. RHAY321 TaxID=2944807 RepID=UPI00207CD5A0|nr:hypothetical protein [Micromonospora sp. RHAY321]MCO1599197.1 hypothetical protein [Micromonospora sp. RHAY321]
MTLSTPKPDVAGPPRPDPRAPFLVMVGWYGVLVASYGAYLGSLSGDVPAGCGGGCDSDRSRMLLFGLYTATPALFLALLISLVALWLLTTRGRTRSALLVGTLSAAPALVVAGIVAAVAPPS